MKLEGATNIHLEKVFRLGKRKPDAIRPRTIVVKFSRLSDRAKVKNASGRLKDTKFGISPQYPREIVERRKRLVPIMLKERKQNKTAYIVDDKLCVNGEIWEGLVRKLRDKEFVQIVSEYDVLCLSECWVKCPDEFELDGYEKKYLARSKCGGSGVVVGIEPDFIVENTLDKHLLDTIDFISYVSDVKITDRLSEDLKAPNGFGRRILDICKSIGLRICNGRFGTDSSKYTFQNKNGCSLIDYMLISQDSIFTLIKALTVKDFNMFSCHAPLSVELYLNVDRKINDQCNCVKSVYNRVKWNEGFKDGLVNDMLTNVQKFDDLMLNLTEHENDIDKCVGALNNMNRS
ncbi:Hypothetical predicted protein [Mytilus galloprovincialis]|uniref:Endonuclease/exonuclease/phosphatase domain-containing protein n=1 Tax=Mytilus galloprovincialis TaxID=29158 RepID=A0A8B6ERA4_MYTGA|nr:Hypothetical predicted protein [Mytilus galloprovincialis]